MTLSAIPAFTDLGGKPSLPRLAELLIGKELPALTVFQQKSTPESPEVPPIPPADAPASPEATPPPLIYKKPVKPKPTPSKKPPEPIQETGGDLLMAQLEPMIRSSARRAVAEQLEAAQPFGKVGLGDRLKWRLQAFFTSRTFDEVAFDRTNRYQVEEVFLVDERSLTFLSHASIEPSRHANGKKVSYDFKRLLKDLPEDRDDNSFKLPNRRTAMIVEGHQCFLIASVRGPLNQAIERDLNYLLKRAEFRLTESADSLQVLLEEALLIRSIPVS